MGVKIITFDGKQVSSRHDAIQWDLLHGKNGIISGCELTYVSSNIVHMNAGYMIIKGHLIEVTESDISCELSSSGTILGRIYIRMDLSDINTPSLISIARSILPELEKDELCNYNNGIYEEELATYTAATTVISNLVSTGNHLYGPRAEILDSMEEIKANTYASRFMGALAGKELSESANGVPTLILPTDWIEDSTDSRYLFSCTKKYKTMGDSVSFGLIATAANGLKTALEYKEGGYVKDAVPENVGMTMKFYATAKPTGPLKFLVKGVTL